MSPEGMQNVSRETSERLGEFAELVQKWTAKINLISRQSAAEIWDRHIWDSAQLFELAPAVGKWVDLGSGGGFPAIVLAILSKGAGHSHHFVLVESDQRKAVFLRTAIRELDLDGEVISRRIEAVDPLNADILTARALADLEVLLSFAERHLAEGGTALFPKGATWKQEQEIAQQMWSYKCDPIKSTSNPDAAVLRIKDIARV